MQCYLVSTQINHAANDDEERSRSVEPVCPQDQLSESCSKPPDGIFLRIPRSLRKRKFIVYVAVSADGFIARPGTRTRSIYLEKQVCFAKQLSCKWLVHSRR
jgi:hypothetical protein